MASTNLLDVALALDPRFGVDMPQEIADAFANNEVMRIFRTSPDLPPMHYPQNPRNIDRCI